MLGGDRENYIGIQPFKHEHVTRRCQAYSIAAKRQSVVISNVAFTFKMMTCAECSWSSCINMVTGKPRPTRQCLLSTRVLHCKAMQLAKKACKEKSSRQEPLLPEKHRATTPCIVVQALEQPH